MSPMFMGPRRRGGRPPPIAEHGGDAPPLELSVHVSVGAEAGALKELRDLGITQVEQVGPGQLRVIEPGPLRPLLAAERPIAIYAVRSLGASDLALLEAEPTVRVALELAGIVAGLNRGRLRNYRVTVAHELGRDRGTINRLKQQLASRLRIDRAVERPDLSLVVRPGRDGLELAARLPRPGEARGGEPRVSEPAPPRRTSRPPPPPPEE